MQQPFMLDAIKALPITREEEQKEHLAVFDYLQACNLLFENGILSREPICEPTSRALQNIQKGFNFFKEWKEHMSNSTAMYAHDNFSLNL